MPPPRDKVNYRSPWEPLNQLTVNMAEMVLEWSSTNFTFLCCLDIEDGHHARKKFSRTKISATQKLQTFLIIINNDWIMNKKIYQCWWCRFQWASCFNVIIHVLKYCIKVMSRFIYYVILMLLTTTKLDNHVHCTP